MGNEKKEGTEVGGCDKRSAVNWKHRGRAGCQEETVGKGTGVGGFIAEKKSRKKKGSWTDGTGRGTHYKIKGHKRKTSGNSGASLTDRLTRG